MNSRVFRTEVEIEATPDRVWAVLVDLPRYPEWNPFTIAAVSPALAPGAPVDLTVRMSRRSLTLRQRETVREVVPNARLSWGMSMLSPRVISGERTQTLERLPGGRTRYVSEDVIGGLLSPLVFALFATSLEDGFAAMGQALRAEVERRRDADAALSP